VSAKAVKISTFLLPGSSVLRSSQNQQFEMLQLGIIGRRDLVHRRQQGINDFQIDLQFVLPRRQVHVGEADLDLAADLAVANGWQSSSSSRFSNWSVRSSTDDIGALIEGADLG
jgi:hypothetical protein